MKCDTCKYNKRCPIQRAKDAENCKPKYYENNMWKYKIPFGGGEATA